MSLPDRFWAKVKRSEDCWEWVAAKTKAGYGVFNLEGTTTYAHRLTYWDEFGVLPRGMDLDHKCRNRGCVNPSHLEAVSHHENVLRGDVGKHNAIKTHCPKGHEYSGANLYIQPKRGGRECRACRSERAQERKKKVD